MKKSIIYGLIFIFTTQPILPAEKSSTNKTITKTPESSENFKYITLLEEDLKTLSGGKQNLETALFLADGEDEDRLNTIHEFYETKHFRDKAFEIYLKFGVAIAMAQNDEEYKNFIERQAFYKKFLEKKHQQMFDIVFYLKTISNSQNCA